MLWSRRVCSGVRIPHSRCSRFRLYATFTATALLFSVFTLFLNSISSSVRSEVQVSIPSESWRSQLPEYQPTSRKMDFDLNKHLFQLLNTITTLRPNETTIYQEQAETQDPVEPNPFQIVWDNSLTYTDRIVEQLNYVPKRRSSAKAINILVLSKSGGEMIVPGNDQFKHDQCPVSNCFLMTSLNASVHADALITSSPYMNQYEEVVKYRKEEDVWIYYELERPYLMLDLEKESFNWTATYRHDSTLVAPYEKWVPLDKSSSYYLQQTALSLDNNNASRNYAQGKRKMAAALISNCGAERRMTTIKALSEYIQVDIYGGCGIPCGNDCFHIIKRDYKFYLAFENSNCVDYVTEKLFRNALNNDVIPVVFGAPTPDYLRVAPPYSYIHINNFPSLAHLTEYLIELDTNDHLYNAYFKWQGTGSFINTKFWCRLCALLSDLDKPRLVVHDLSKWLNDKICID